MLWLHSRLKIVVFYSTKRYFLDLQAKLKDIKVFDLLISNLVLLTHFENN